jgi:hypothetical protein
MKFETCVATQAGLHVKWPLLLSYFIQNWIDKRILIKLPHIKSRENRFSVSGVVSRKWIDEQSDFIE